MAERATTGVLLINLGTPRAPETGAVRAYLRQFLTDPRVIDIPAVPRALIVYLTILPTRPQKSAAAYKKIWGPRGSPLLAESRDLAEKVAAALGPAYAVELGMRYGEPSIPGALERLIARGAARVVVAPLYPQYSAAATASSIDEVMRASRAHWDVPPLLTLEPFYDDPGFIRAFEAVARPVLEASRPDHVVMSFHGLPERQIKKSDATGAHCLASASCCDAIVPANRSCYRAHCFATARLLAERLGLDATGYTVCFQSRLGRNPWIRPYTDFVLPELAAKGHKRLAVLCPAFVADCLETLEEVAIRGREQWLSLGGEELVLVPSLNSSPAWVEAVSAMVRRVAPDK
jgi:protoporphyrin/coproporphyrin ferrochelatase